MAFTVDLKKKIGTLWNPRAWQNKLCSCRRGDAAACRWPQTANMSVPVFVCVCSYCQVAISRLHLKFALLRMRAVAITDYLIHKIRHGQSRSAVNCEIWTLSLVYIWWRRWVTSFLQCQHLLNWWLKTCERIPSFGRLIQRLIFMHSWDRSTTQKCLNWTLKGIFCSDVYEVFDKTV